ncbi:unnamed protein product [Rotaria sp. Silwood2]|nr:unnamed protein product [Rotaria sp. Silwood2]
MDVPRNLIEKNLRARLTAPTTTAAMRFFTRLMVWFSIFVQNILAALEFLEQWYAIMNVPVIKISQLQDKLDHDTTTGNIQWTQHSIDVIVEAIKRAIEQRGPLHSTIDKSLIPWQIARKSNLYRE